MASVAHRCCRLVRRVACCGGGGGRARDRGLLHPETDEEDADEPSDTDSEAEGTQTVLAIMDGCIIDAVHNIANDRSNAQPAIPSHVAPHLCA
jgi:hypothetical protein